MDGPPHLGLGPEETEAGGLVIRGEEVRNGKEEPQTGAKKKGGARSFTTESLCSENASQI